MKRLFFLLTVLGAMPLSALAQDDLYFTPTSKTRGSETEKPAYYCGSKQSVDKYNRRGQLRSMYQKIGNDSLSNGIVNFPVGFGMKPDSVYSDSTFYGPSLNDDDYAYSRRMSRWDGFYDPWLRYYYGPWGYNPWYYGYAGWYDPWYYGYGGWYDPWYYGYAGWYGPWYGWYSPWYYSGWYGWGYPYYGWYDWGWPRGGYAYGGGNPRGYTGSRTWGYGDRGGSNVTFGRGGVRTTGNNGNTYTWGSSRNRSFGGRTTTTRPVQNNNTFGTATRSSSFGGSFGGGSFGGGSFGGGSFGGGFGGGHSAGGGGGHFGGGRR